MQKRVDCTPPSPTLSKCLF